ncbi:MAG: BolA/IbaG family iron-sulfur metabolism protein [Gammaproteobacteria bacterium]|nr:BolA/IbaG family iron-sulfur metabolism protein [Gammaproteobacteria bacterium]
MEPAEIKRLIESGIPGCAAEVEGDGTHFSARIVSERFSGKSLLQQHRIVYEALGGRVGTEIHALSLQTLTPEQWSRKLALKVD